MPYVDSTAKYHAFRKAIKGLALTNWRETDANGDVGNIVANGGVLASDTTPILRATNKAQEINWAASNSDPIAVMVELDEDFSGANDVLVEMWVASGTTDAASFTLESSWDGAAAVSDTITDGAKSASMHKITGTIPASDIPDGASFASFILTPAAHTTNAINLHAIRLSYLPKTVA